MRYKIVNKHDLRKLEEEIESLLRQGWKLQGGVSSTLQYTASGTIEYSQALVFDSSTDHNQR